MARIQAKAALRDRNVSRRSLSARHEEKLAWAISSVSSSRRLSVPPTWSKWPWVNTMARVGAASTAS